MRCYDPEDEWDVKSKDELGPSDWQLDLLKLNPEYVHWGPHEDYMGKGKDAGWEAPIAYSSWSEHNMKLDDLNEVVHFYFQIDRESKTCPVCQGTGYHPDAQWVSESFYEHSSPFKPLTESEYRTRAFLRGFSRQDPDAPDNIFDQNKANFPSEEILEKYGPEFRKFCEEMRDHPEHSWRKNITEDEAQVLIDAGRGRGSREGLVTAQDFNRAESSYGMTGHDAINQSILVEARLKRFGIPQKCEECNGHGYVYTKDHTTLNLVYWLIHPRKGASRGVEVKNIQREELPEVFAFLKEAADRNAQRFSKAVSMAEEIGKVII